LGERYDDGQYHHFVIFAFSRQHLTTAVNIIDLNLTLTSLTISSSYAALTAITAFSKQQQKKKKYTNK